MRSTLKEALSLESSEPSLNDGVSLESSTLSIIESAVSLENLSTTLDVLGDAQDKAMSLEGYLEDAEVTRVDEDALAISMESVGISLEKDTPQLDDKRTGIKVFIKKVWEAIKRTVKAISEAFKSFIKKYFDGVTRLKRKVTDMESDFEKLVKDKQLNAKETGAEFNVAQTIAEGLIASNEISKDTIDEGIGKIIKVTSTLDDITQHTATTYIALEQHLSKWKDGKSEDGLDDLKLDINNQKLEGAAIALKDAVLPGMKEFALYYPGGEQWKLERGDAHHYQFIGILVDADNARRSQLRDTTMEGLSVADVFEYFKKLNGLLDTILGNRKGIEKLKKQRESFNKAAEQWVSNLEKGKIGKFMSKVQIKRHMDSIRHNGQRTVTQLNRYLYTYCLNLTKFINSSMGSFKGES